jgi:tetratricopeptide (TPR) repeat protein
MNRLGGLLLLAALAYPCAAAAQKRPSNSMHTRSAEIYLERAKGESRPDERTDLLTKALEVLTEGMKSDPGNPKIWFLAGQAYTRLNDVAGADSAFDRAESLYPEYLAETDTERMALWINMYNSGLVALQEGDEAKAIANFEGADAIYSGRPEATVSLGSLYAHNGDLTKAEAAYRTTLEIIRGPAAEGLDAAGKADWAEQEATAATRLAALLAQSGKGEEAIAVLQTLVERQPANGQAKSALATALVAAGQTEQAARLYEQILSSDDLDDVALFNTGVGLYQAQQFELAARAFEMSIAKNPYSRDALYNLGQAQYAAATELEKQRDASPDAERATINQKLAAVYEKLAGTAEQLRALDPNQKSALMMLAQAQRSLGELASDAAVAEEWKQKVLATLEAAQAIPFEVTGVVVAPGEDRATVKGNVMNLTVPAGQSIVLEFTLFDMSGEAVGTHEVTVIAPQPDAHAEFSFDVPTSAPATGWKYRVAG